MVSFEDNLARIKGHFRFNPAEISGMAMAILVVGIILSLGDWGAEEFTLMLWLKAFISSIIIVTLSLFFRTSCQKTYALSQGYRADFKVWWLGLGLSLVLTLLIRAKFPIVLIGTVVAVFMVRQRLGEFRYGFSYWNNAIIALWGILGSLIMAAIFALLGYFFPENLFFSKGVIFNLALSVFALLPVPQSEGFGIFFGARFLYVIALLVVLVAGTLLLIGTWWSIMTGIIGGIIAGIFYTVIGSEK